MSSQYHSLTVVLEKNLRDEELEPLIHAIGMMRHVLSVKGNVSNLDVHCAEERAKYTVVERLVKIVTDS